MIDGDGLSYPSFGVNLFYLKGVVPPRVTMADIYRSIGPFVMHSSRGAGDSYGISPDRSFPAQPDFFRIAKTGGCVEN